MQYSEENKRGILGVTVSNIEEEQMNNIIVQWIASREESGKYIVTPNPEFVLLAQKKEWAKEEINKADLAIPDGVGLVFADLALNRKDAILRHTGVDAIYRICAAAEWVGGRRMMLIGGEEYGDVRKGTISRSAEILKEKYPNTEIRVYDPGKLQEGMEKEIAEKALNQDCVFIALPMEWQLKVIAQLKSREFKGVAMGVGGAFDMIGGALQRAPEAWRSVGMEWLWRVIKQPARIRRIYKAAIVFPIKVAYTAWVNKHFTQSVKYVFVYLIKKPYGKY